MSKKLVKKVLVIGWDAADWKVIEPLMAQGKMPALQRLMDGAVFGRIQTLDPPLSPMLWTSIATGVRADKHGIKGFIEPIPDGSGLRPVTTTSRKVKAIWNILNQNGYKSNVVSWWPSNPAEPINGVMVSNLYQTAGKSIEEEWPMVSGTVFPESLAEELKALRVHPHELTLSIAAPFIPDIIENKDLRKSKQVAGLMKIIAESASVHAAATHLMTTTDWDFMAVYYDAIDHFSHLGMKYHPPHRPEISKEDYDHFNGVVEGGYRFQDMMLDRMLDLIDDDTTIVLLSDHGFHSDHQRPLYIPKEPSGPAVEHSPYGILVFSGPGIKQGGGRVSGATVLDITPTLLTLFGLPVGKDMEGRILSQVFSEPVTPEYINSWEDIPGNTGQHSSEHREDPWAAQEAMKQLVELGYIEALDDNKLTQIEKNVRESDYYVARNMLDGGRVDDAIPLLERIFNESGIQRYGQRLAAAYLTKKQYLKVGALIERLKEMEQAEIQRKQQENSEKENSDPFANPELEMPLYLDYMEGIYLLAINKPQKALPLLEKVQQKNPANSDLAMNIARVHFLRKNYKKAEEQFIKALAIDHTNADAHHGLGNTYLRRNMLDEALDEFLSATEYNFIFPQAHYHLGETLFKLGNYQAAEEAFRVAIRFAPGMSRAHKWLIRLYEEHLNNTEKAQEHRDFISNNIREEIIVVSGLPRSGTSMMMQMLAAGGIPVLTDGVREADDSNPKGYMEFSPVKKLHLDQTWVGDACGKAIKVVAPLIHHLPGNFDYKVIYMVRPLDEVMVSQQKMLGKPVHKDAIPLALMDAMDKHREKADVWLNAQPNIRFLQLDYAEVVAQPQEVTGIIADFLGRELNQEAMANVVDAQLHRNKIA
jgi:predicted AlkP superfamily phosphohydrolase/phosphomutase/tetratricopeptide (TPR) repeat protein